MDQAKLGMFRHLEEYVDPSTLTMGALHLVFFLGFMLTLTLELCAFHL
jgi:hypothetical protein